MISRHALAAALLLAASVGPACANRDLFVVDLVNNPASLDPQVQWDPDSYFVYRNVFDNLVTRDVAGKIVPQVATAWSYQSDTQIVFTLRDDIRFEDGSLLTPDDVVFTIKRITDPAFKSPQLSQFDSIAAAEAVGANQVRLTTKRPYPVLLAQLVKLSPAVDPRRGWRSTIARTQSEIEEILRDSPSLRSTVPAVIAEALPKAREIAALALAERRDPDRAARSARLH